VEQDKQAHLPASDTCRLAVGVFDVPHDLVNAVAELRSGGFTEREICLAGKRDIVDRLLRGPLEGHASVSPWLTSWRAFRLPSVGIEDGGGPYVATSRAVVRQLFDQAKAAQVKTAASASFWPDLCRRLAHDMRRDAVVLLVCANDAALQNRSSRVLLRHATQSVQTYEFMPRR
jgi:hypothetical protein